MRHPLTAAFAILIAGLISLGVGSTATAQDAVSHPAHIHAGTCDTLGDVIQPLSNVSADAINNGTPMAMDMVGSDSAIPVLASITTVPMAFADIVGGEHAVNVHESMENIGNYVACGNVGGMMIGDTDLLFGLAPLNDSGLSGVGSLHDNGDDTTTVYVYLTSDSGGATTPEATPEA